MGKKIVIVSQSHLCRNPRVLKEATALAAAGYGVSIFTAVYSDELYGEDLSLLSGTGISYEIYSDLRNRDWSSYKARLSRKLWLIAQEWGIESRYSLGYNASNLKKRITASRADLYIMHQELATVIGSRMVKKHKVAFDIEDWYSEDLLPQTRKNRPIKLLKNAEKTAIERGAACYTTSLAMAKGLQAYYKTTRQPVVIYNSFNANESITEKPRHDILQLYWFSQTIGQGRGLEFFITCMGKSKVKCKFSLRGNVTDAYKASLIDLVSPKDGIEFLPILENDQIQADMNRYDVGLALEPDSPPNKDLTISNKLFSYMAAGLPVIASRTQGQTEIAEQCPEIIYLYEQHNSHELIELLDTMGSKLHSNELADLRKKVLDHYRYKFSWSVEANKLIKLIKNGY